MISLLHVHKSFGQIRAVRGISFDIQPGQVVGILGPNGAGKTTTVRMITAAIPPSGGRVTVDGLDSVTDSIRVRRRLGYLPESAPLYREMPVGAYLRHRGALYGLRGRKRTSAIDRAVSTCQLQSVRGRRIGQLSKGYRQRVGLASVLIHDPAVLILDEPTSGLDPAQIASARALIRELAGSRTMLLVSHILPEVEKCCDRILLFAGGQIRADGTPGDLARALAGGGRYTIEARADPDKGAPLADIVGRLEGVRECDGSALEGGWERCRVLFDSDAADQRERLAQACAQAGLLVRELRADHPSLEDAYLRLIADGGSQPPADEAPAEPTP